MPCGPRHSVRPTPVGTSRRCTRGSRGGSSTTPTAGHFVDNARMARFVVGFADRYLDARAEPSTAAKCWRGCFDVAGDRSLLIVQHLLIAINAHVNFDLPQAVVQLVDDGAELAAIRPDFDAVNDILAATYDDLLGDLDRVTRWTAQGGGPRWRLDLQLQPARRPVIRRGGRRCASPPRTEPTRRVDIAQLDELGRRARVPRDAPVTTRAVARPAPSSARDPRPSTGDDGIARPVGVKNPVLSASDGRWLRMKQTGRWFGHSQRPRLTRCDRGDSHRRNRQ